MDKSTQTERHFSVSVDPFIVKKTKEIFDRNEDYYRGLGIYSYSALISSSMLKQIKQHQNLLKFAYKIEKGPEYIKVPIEYLGDF